MFNSDKINKKHYLAAAGIAVFALAVALFCCSCQHYVKTDVVDSAVKGTPGETTVKNIIKTAMAPIGNTMFIQSGGWNDELTGGNSQVNALGLSKKWEEFYDKNASTISKETADQYNANNGKAYRDCGLNESSYIGWTLYNVFNNKKDYCFPVRTINSELQSMSLGQEVQNKNVRSQRPGDVMVCKNFEFAYITLGACEDGSALYLCCNYPAVMLVGSTTPSGDKNSIANQLATDYINKYIPDASKVLNREPINYQNLIDCTELNWNNSVTDPDGYRKMEPKQILDDIFATED